MLLNLVLTSFGTRGQLDCHDKEELLWVALFSNLLLGKEHNMIIRSRTGFVLLFLLTGCGEQVVSPSLTTTTVLQNPIAMISPTSTFMEAPSLTETPTLVMEMTEPLKSPFPLQPTPQDIIGGGTVQSGPFMFLLWLFRDPSLNQQPVTSSLYSDMNGIGAYMFWIYRGDDPIGPVETYWGTLPYIDQLLMGTFPVINNGNSGGRNGGILLPGGIITPGESKVGDEVRLEIKIIVHNSEYGALLIFTLRQGENGFEPENISVDISHLDQD
jgi:hypothetical protein